MSAPKKVMDSLTDDQKLVIRERMAVAYLNFDMAGHMCVLHSLRDEAGNVAKIQATLDLLGGGFHMKIVGDASGFFATPVIQMAIFDIRSSIEFFGMRYDVKKDRFLRDDPSGDDVGVSHFVSNPPDVATFLSGRGKPEFANTEHNLKKVILWSNKRLAHFTRLAPGVNLEEIRDSCLFMRDAYETHFYSPQGLPFPSPGSPA